MEDPHFSINPGKALQDIVQLVAVSLLPVSTYFFMAKDLAHALHRPEAKPESPQESKATGEEAQEKEPSPHVPHQQLSTVRYRGSQGTKGLLAVVTMASSVQCAHSQRTGDNAEPIDITINDAETLGKIGREPGYPLNGTYRQTADIDVAQSHQSIGDYLHPFTGQYDGRCHTISNLTECFVGMLDQGSISNLRFTDAKITSTQRTGLAACAVNGIVSNIQVENVYISTSGAGVETGIGGGVVYERGKVAKITALNCRVETSGDDAPAGIGGGVVHGMVTETTAVNCRVETSGDGSNAGIGAGEVESRGKVTKTTALNSTVETSGGGADAAIGGGQVYWGAVAETTALDSTVETLGIHSDVGIGGGKVQFLGTVAHTSAVTCRVETSGDDAGAGIGAGWIQAEGTIANTSAVTSRVETSGDDADASIGAGWVQAGATVANTKAVNITVNGIPKNLGSISDDQLLCQKADQRLLTANCSSRPEFLGELDFPHGGVCPVNAATASTAAMTSTAATVGITTGPLLGAAAGLGIVGYSTYQWFTGYRKGVRGQELAMKPLTCGRELADATANAVSQGIKKLLKPS